MEDKILTGLFIAIGVALGTMFLLKESKVNSCKKVVNKHIKFNYEKWSDTVSFCYLGDDVIPKGEYKADFNKDWVHLFGQGLNVWMYEEFRLYSDYEPFPYRDSNLKSFDIYIEKIRNSILEEQRKKEKMVRREEERRLEEERAQFVRQKEIALTLLHTFLPRADAMELAMKASKKAMLYGENKV